MLRHVIKEQDEERGESYGIKGTSHANSDAVQDEVDSEHCKQHFAARLWLTEGL